MGTQPWASESIQWETCTSSISAVPSTGEAQEKREFWLLFLPGCLRLQTRDLTEPRERAARKGFAGQVTWNFGVAHSKVQALPVSDSV